VLKLHNSDPFRAVFVCSVCDWAVERRPVADGRDDGFWSFPRGAEGTLLRAAESSKLQLHLRSPSRSDRSDEYGGVVYDLRRSLHCDSARGIDHDLSQAEFQMRAARAKVKQLGETRASGNGLKQSRALV